MRTLYARKKKEEALTASLPLMLKKKTFRKHRAKKEEKSFLPGIQISQLGTRRLALTRVKFNYYSKRKKAEMVKEIHNLVVNRRQNEPFGFRIIGGKDEGLSFKVR